MKNKVQVIMLSTEYTKINPPAIIDLTCNGLIRPLGNTGLTTSKYYNLYITSDDKIIDGDYYVNFIINKNDPNYGNIPDKVIKADLNKSNDFLIEPFSKYCKKIIATTDPKLTRKEDRGFNIIKEFLIPQIQQSFLKEYVDNPDGEYEVEYKREVITVDNSSELPQSNSRYKEHKYEGDWKLKLNQDNTVNITSVEERMYNREEVESILFQYAEDEYAWFSCKSEIESFNDWIKENL